MCSEDAQDDGADSVVPHDGDLQNRRGDVERQDGDGDGDDEHQDGGGQLGEHTLDDLDDDVGGKDQQEHGKSQEGLVIDQSSDDGSAI